MKFQFIAAAALRKGDKFYRVVQDTREVAYDEGVNTCSKNARIGNRHSVIVDTDDFFPARFNPDAIVAIEVES